MDKVFGIIEIPVRRYSEPIAPVVRLKGLETGKIYFRRGSSNAEAVGNEIIRINNWLTNLPDHQSASNINEEITSILIKATSQRIILSECISETLKFANENRLDGLIHFCRGELAGWHEFASNQDVIKRLGYREQNVLITNLGIEVNPYHSITPEQLYKELKQVDGVHEISICFPNSVSSIEREIDNFRRKQNSVIGILSSKASQIFPKIKNSNDYAVSVFVTANNYENLYNSIRQELIKRLLNVESHPYLKG